MELLPPFAAFPGPLHPIGLLSLRSLFPQNLSVIQDRQAWDLTDHILPVVYVLGQTPSIEVAGCCLVVHHAENLDVGKLAADLLHEDGQVADLVLVDPHGGDAWHVGELDVGRIDVAVQDQSAELLQFTQESWALLQQVVAEVQHFQGVLLG